MIKKISELDKAEKQLLLTAITLGEVDAGILNENCLIGYSYQDYFLGLMVAADNPDVSIVCFGDALKAKADLQQK